MNGLVRGPDGTFVVSFHGAAEGTVGVGDDGHHMWKLLGLRTVSVQGSVCA